ncbi:MAG: hypothetical protein H6581_29970 [Bacteroidia bacterium]|nr:hypothetical protein [Bacteroidia bacterium]
METDPFLTTIVVNHLVPSTRHVIIKDDGQTVIDEWLDSNENVELPPDSTVHIRWVYVTSD